MRSSAEIESKDGKIEELQVSLFKTLVLNSTFHLFLPKNLNEELQHQLSKTQKELETQKSTVTKCINVVKDLLIEKSTIERKEARSKVMQNRLRLGQFVTQRVGASFQVKGYL